MMLRDAKSFRELVCELRELGSFALDTEFIRENSYRPHLCLLQIATRKRSVLVDPFATGDLMPFVELILDPSIEKILHAGEQDMEIFFAFARDVPRNIVDTQVAAALAGRGESISYGRLVEDICGVRLTKVETFTDWSRRPLTDAQFQYALDDVKYLYPMIDSLRRDLAGLGRLDWLADELQFYEERSVYERDRRELYRRIRGSFKLEPRELAILRELAAWREEEAERLDWPRSRILQDEVLVDLARRAPREVESMAAVRGIHPQLLRRCGGEIVRRVALALALKPQEYPPPLERGTDDPAIERVADLLEVVLRARATELKIAPSYLASRKDLMELARLEMRRTKDAARTAPGAEPAASSLPVLSGWRRRLVGEELLRLLDGRAHVMVAPTEGCIKILDA